MDTLDDFTTLEQDATLAEPLRRVAYEAGMMLGLEATRDEQAYHRRRLTRQQYWLHGYGTLAGMVVSMQPVKPPVDAGEPLAEPAKQTVRLLVSPGLGIDGLGREVLIRENYCINLGEWLAAQTESHLREGYSDEQDQLWLKVCVRQKDCPVAKQPVLARELNLSTDAVQPSRTAESVQLELIPELPPELLSPPEDEQNDAYRPWAGHDALDGDVPLLTLAEQQLLQQLKSDNPGAGAQLELHARLLHALDGSGLDSRRLNDDLNDLEDSARLLLARISIHTTDINKLVLNPLSISINNLVRPFLVTASQLAWLARQS